MALKAIYCEADEDTHLALRDSETGACPYCTAPPEPLGVPVDRGDERDD